MALHSAIKGKLLSVIGDEVSESDFRFSEKNQQNLQLSINFGNFTNFQDTCVGFLLGGVGEINKNRHPNFMVVDKSEFHRPFASINNKMKTNENFQNFQTLP